MIERLDSAAVVKFPSVALSALCSASGKITGPAAEPAVGTRNSARLAQSRCTGNQWTGTEVNGGTSPVASRFQSMTPGPVTDLSRLTSQERRALPGTGPLD